MVLEGGAPHPPPPEARSEDFLLIPDPAPLRAWWTKVRGQLTPKAAHLGGAPRNPQALRQALAHSPTWRRAVYTLESAAQERSGVSTDIRGWARGSGGVPSR
jgi:hypothetical protein